MSATVAYGWDSVKLDSCGAQKDLSLYAALYNATGKAIMIENCHQGSTVPNATWCPWNYFRTSYDVRASYESIVGNLQTTIGFAKSGLSAPGCWAYPVSHLPTLHCLFCARHPHPVRLLPYTALPPHTLHLLAGHA